MFAADGAAASCCSDVMKAATCSSALSVRLLASSEEASAAETDELAAADGARAGVRFIRARGRAHKRGADASCVVRTTRSNKFPRRRLAGARGRSQTLCGVKTRRRSLADGARAARREPPAIDDYDLGHTLGEGSFGSVILCTHRASGKKYAVKVIEVVHAQRHNGIAQVIQEKKVLIMLDHPSIIKLHSTFKDADSLYIVLEYCSGGELFGHIKRLGSCHISCARWLTAELVNVLEYIHGRRVLHRDLKPENILLDDLGHVKLVDFGSSKRLDVEDDVPKFVGTAQYVSPEVLNDADASEASDLWALACIVFQMLSGEPPFAAPVEYAIFKKIEERDFAFPADGFPPRARELVDAMLQLEPDARLGAPACGGYAALKAHPFFTDDVEAPIDFASVHLSPPPPLVPPPPMPEIAGDAVLNGQLAEHELSAADRANLIERQAGTRWAQPLDDGEVRSSRLERAARHVTPDFPHAHRHRIPTSHGPHSHAYRCSSWRRSRSSGATSR